MFYLVYPAVKVLHLHRHTNTCTQTHAHKHTSNPQLIMSDPAAHNKQASHSLSFSRAAFESVVSHSNECKSQVLVRTRSSSFFSFMLPAHFQKFKIKLQSPTVLFLSQQV